MNRTPQIQNVLTTANLNCSLDLHYIATHALNVEYNPARFNGLTMRLQKPKSSANVFASGRIVCLGTTDEETARKATRRFARIIQRLGFDVKFTDFKITNIVASHDLHVRPDFNIFYRDNKRYVDYNPELFPGLIYRGGADGVTVMVFKSGKVILTNAKTRQQIYDAYDEFETKIKKV